MATYKEAQEAFVSNLNGTTTMEIFLVSAVLQPLCNFAYFALLTKLAVSRNNWLEYLLQYLVLAVPVLLFFTCLANHSSSLGAVAVIAATAVFFAGGRLRTSAPAATGGNSKHDASSATTANNVASSITSLRAFVNIATAVAILGVDFTAFPRRFAKVETFGTGLMDVGVGMYVFSMALVSRQARQQPGESLLRGWKTLAALVVLGAGRLVTTKTAAYQEHTSEYGVHWNFFFTLAMLKIFMLLTSPVWTIGQGKAASVSFWSPLLTAAVVGVAYQVLLEGFGLTEFIQHSWLGDGARTDLISANREGILSSLGYFSLYCAAVQLGRCLWTFPGKAKCLAAFSILPMLSLTALQWLGAVQPISRRMANLPFVLWQLHHGSAVLWGFYIVYCAFLATHVDGQPVSSSGSTRRGKAHRLSPSPPLLLAAISQNQLVFFLAANLATGAVNMSMRTIYAPVSVSMCVLALYMAGLCSLAVAMYRKR